MLKVPNDVEIATALCTCIVCLDLGLILLQRSANPLLCSEDPVYPLCLQLARVLSLLSSQLTNSPLAKSLHSYLRQGLAESSSYLWGYFCGTFFTLDTVCLGIHVLLTFAKSPNCDLTYFQAISGECSYLCPVPKEGNEAVPALLSCP